MSFVQTSRKKYFIGWLLLLSTAMAVLPFMISCGNADETPAAHETGTEYTTGDEDNAILRDAELLAETANITIEEAFERFGTQNQAGELQSIVKNNEATWAGTWIDYEPEHRLVFAFAGDGEAIMKKYVEEGSPLAEKIKILHFEYSYSELEDTRDGFKEMLESHDMYSFPYIDMKNNTVYFEVTDKEKTEAAMQENGLALPGCAELVQKAGLVIPDDAIVTGSGSTDDLLWEQWWAVSINGSDIAGRYTSLFAGFDGMIHGNAGCNSYLGFFNTKENAIRLSAGIATALGCEEEVLAQGDEYIECLRNTISFEVIENTMVFYGADGNELVVFEKLPDVPMNPADLKGTAWQVSSMDGEDITPEEWGNLFFDEDGVSIHGIDRTTKLELSYKANEDLIVITSAKSERVKDENGEYVYGAGSPIGMISQAFNYRLYDDRLELYTERKSTIIFVPLEE